MEPADVDLITAISMQAAKNLETDGAVATAAILVGRNGGGQVLPVVWRTPEGKESALATVAAQAANLPARMIVLVCESWMTHLDTGHRQDALSVYAAVPEGCFGVSTPIDRSSERPVLMLERATSLMKVEGMVADVLGTAFLPAETC